MPSVTWIIQYHPTSPIDYIHRIGRTGRRGIQGLATTFINKTCGRTFSFNLFSLYFVSQIDEALLLDLKHLLIEAKQPVPPFLLQLESDKERLLEIGGKVFTQKKLLLLFFIYLF